MSETKHTEGKYEHIFSNDNNKWEVTDGDTFWVIGEKHHAKSVCQELNRLNEATADRDKLNDDLLAACKKIVHFGPDAGDGYAQEMRRIALAAIAKADRGEQGETPTERKDGE